MTSAYQNEMLLWFAEKAPPEVLELNHTIRSYGMTWFDFEDKVLPVQPWAMYEMQGGNAYTATRLFANYVEERDLQRRTV